MQPWAHITLHTLLHSWTSYMTCSLMFRDQSRPDRSSYGTMLVSIGLLWSATGLQITHSSLYSTSPILSILESNWRVLLCLALEGLWPSSPSTHSPFTGNGGGRWGYWPGIMSGLDTPFQKIFSPVPWTRGHCMWCRRNFVAGPRETTRCRLISFFSSVKLLFCFDLEKNTWVCFDVCK